MLRWNAIAVAVAALGLSVIGLVMLASTSYYIDEAGGENYYTLRQHALWLGFSFAACLVGAMMDYHVLYRLRWWIFGATVIVLGLCFTPMFGESVNGAARWISLKKFGLRAIHFQPSEFAKLSAAIVLAGWFARQEPLTREFGGGFLKPSLIVIVLTLLIGAEVDLGSAALVAAVGGGMMFVAGTAAHSFSRRCSCCFARRICGRRQDDAQPGGAHHGVSRPGEIQGRPRPPAMALAARVRLRRPARAWPRQRTAEDELPARGAHRLHLPDGRRGVRPRRHHASWLYCSRSSSSAVSSWRIVPRIVSASSSHLASSSCSDWRPS